MISEEDFLLLAGVLLFLSLWCSSFLGRARAAKSSNGYEHKDRSHRVYRDALNAISLINGQRLGHQVRPIHEALAGKGVTLGTVINSFYIKKGSSYV